MSQDLWSLLGLKENEVVEIGDTIYKGNHKLTFYDMYHLLVDKYEGVKLHAALIMLGKKIAETQAITQAENLTRTSIGDILEQSKDLLKKFKEDNE